MTVRARPVAAHALFLLSVAVAVAALWWARLRDWYPHDEGTLAQAALRVLQGQVPHREFAHPYTGADALLHGNFFRILGSSLESIRTGFVLLTTVWLLGMAGWFRRHLGANGAAVAVALLGGWSVAIYPAAVPSWYVTMLVTSALALLVVPGRTRADPGAVVWAGVALGLALSFKVSAIYGVVGIVAWVALDRSATERGGRPWVIILMLLAALAACRLLWPTATARTVVHLLLPPLAVAGAVIAIEIRHWRRESVALGIDALRTLALLTAGIVLGAAPVLGWLWANGALGGFFESLADVGSLRATYAGLPPPPLGALLVAIPLLALPFIARLTVPPRPWVVMLPCAFLLVLAWNDFVWHRMVWQALRGAVPIGVVLALVLIGRRPGERRWPWLAAVTALAWMVLSQFPFGAALYFVYLIPIAVMVSIGAAAFATRGRLVLATVGTLLAAFGYVLVIPTAPAAVGWSRTPLARLARLPGPHGGLHVPVEDSVRYDGLLGILADSVPPGPIWAGPDSPEIAFLAGRRDLNPASFGFLQRAGGDDHTAGAMALVVRTVPPFSPAPTAAQWVAWQRRFSKRIDLGPFTVLWGEPACSDC